MGALNLGDCALGPFWALDASLVGVGRTLPFQVRWFFPCIYNGLMCDIAKIMRCVPNDAVGVRARAHLRHVGEERALDGS